MAWLYLALAALFEIAFAISMKAANGFTNLWASIGTLAGATGGIFFLTLALKTMPVSVGYPIWVGLGALGTVIFGFFFFQESLNLLKICSITLILMGVVGLKFSVGP